MKKQLIGAVVVIGMSAGAAWAGHFTDLLPPASTAGCVPVSNGYDYQCTSDTGSTGIVATGAMTLSTATFSGSVGLWQRSLTQLSTLTPGTTGQLVYCTNCTSSQICVSSGIGNAAWVAISSGVSNAVNACK